MNNKARAINDFVIIKKSKVGVRKLESGLEISESLDEESQFRKATVMNSGQFESILSEGDQILYNKSSGNGSPDLPQDWLIIKVRDIAAVL